VHTLWQSLYAKIGWPQPALYQGGHSPLILSQRQRLVLDALHRNACQLQRDRHEHSIIAELLPVLQDVMLSGLLPAQGTALTLYSSPGSWLYIACLMKTYSMSGSFEVIHRIDS